MKKLPTRAFWMTVGIFAVVGRFVGGLAVGSAMLLRGGGFIEPVTAEDFLTLPLIALLGFPFGFAPAAITGYVTSLTSPHVPSKPGWVALSTTAGATISLLFFAAIFQNLEAAVLFAAVGGIAALVSALVSLKVRPRWSN